MGSWQVMIEGATFILLWAQKIHSAPLYISFLAPNYTKNEIKTENNIDVINQQTWLSQKGDPEPYMNSEAHSMIVMYVMHVKVSKHDSLCFGILLSSTLILFMLRFITISHLFCRLTINVHEICLLVYL